MKFRDEAGRTGGALWSVGGKEMRMHKWMNGWMDVRFEGPLFRDTIPLSVLFFQVVLFF